MHTYRKLDDDNGWCVCFHRLDEPIGPVFHLECEAAAFASFLNGGRYSPDEIAPIFAVPVDEVDEDEDSIHPDRPDFDYKLERKRG